MTTPAGWYPDPSGGGQRYWDGERWTEHVAPLAPAAPAPEATAATSAPTAASSEPFVAPLAAEPETASKGRPSGKLLGGAAAAVLVVVAGFFAYQQLASADGGADSPEEAVSALMEALSDEDVVGMAEVLLPGERRTYVDPMLEGVGHLQRWGVLDEGLDTSDVAGFDFEVSDLDVRAEMVTGDIANVFASGSMTASLDGASLPVGDLLEERALQGQDMSELDEPAETSPFDDVMITTVQEDGRWYVSMMYTLAETARREAGMLPIEPADGVAPVGAGSPEEAVDGMVQAITDLDLRAVVSRLNPDEAQALQRYAPLFLDEAQAEIDAELAGSGLEIRIDDLQYDVVRRDGVAIVQFRGFSLSGSADGEEMSMTFDGECSVVTADGETEEICAGDGPGIDLTDTPVGDLEEMFSDMDEVGLVVAQRDGQWFVSPVRTYSDLLLSVMRAIDRDELERIIDALSDGSVERWLEDELGEMLEEAFGTTGFEGFEEMTTTTESEDIGGSVDQERELAQLRQECAGGDMEACDDLYWQSPIGSDDEEFGATCGGTADSVGGFCAADQGGGSTSSGADEYGDDEALDALWDACEGGDPDACDDLYWTSPVGSAYEEFGLTCGGRAPEASFPDCATLMGG